MGGVALLSRKPAISLKRGKTRPRLLLMTKRKSHTRFRLVPKSTTLDNFEGPLCTLFQNTCVFRSPPGKFEWRQTPYQRRRCSPMTLVSGKARLMRIFAGFLGDEESNDSGVIENVYFQGFRTLRLRHLRKWGQHYYIVLFSPLSPFHSPQNTWPWITSKSWMAILR